MTVFIRIACLICGYFCGLLETGYIYGKFKGIDIRNYGSGNSGTTNALRVLGKKAGLVVFIGDLFKAIIPCVIVRLLTKDSYPDTFLLFVLYIGLGVVMGHNFPFYLKFKGGKGVAATAGMIIGLMIPWMILILLVLFVAVVAVTRYVSLGSLVVAFYLVINTLAWHMDSPYFVHMLCVSFVFAFFAFFQHRANIARLLNGTEHKIGEKKA